MVFQGLSDSLQIYAKLPSETIIKFFSLDLRHVYETIRIYHECDGGIEKPIQRITVWHQEACRVITNGNREE